MRIEMPGLMAIYRKELADHLGGRRFVILFGLICLAAASSVYVAAQSLRDAAGGDVGEHPFLLLFTSGSGPLPPFFTFISFLGPLVGIALAFDSINDEQNRGTLARLLSQPIYRDAVINGKFLAGLTTVAAMLASITTIVAALGILRLGIVPTGEEAARLLAFVVICTLYVGFWLALSTTFSVLFRQASTSALACIAAWIFATFFVGMIADTIASGIGALGRADDLQGALALEALRENLARLSPTTLFQEGTVAVLVPRIRTLGPILVQDAVGAIPNPLPLGQSLLLVWPQVVGLFALTGACFAVAYARFMTREVRAL